MYRLIPLRMLRRTSGVKFDEMVPSDIPQIHGIAPHHFYSAAKHESCQTFLSPVIFQKSNIKYQIRKVGRLRGRSIRPPT